MTLYVLLDVAKIEQAERIREAEKARLLAAAQRTNRRPSVLKSVLLTVMRS